MLSEAHFFLNEKKKEEEEKLHEAAWLLTVKRKKRNWNCWNRLEIARQISLGEPLYNFWIKETAEAHYKNKTDKLHINLRLH